MNDRTDGTDGMTGFAMVQTTVRMPVTHGASCFNDTVAQDVSFEQSVAQNNVVFVCRCDGASDVMHVVLRHANDVTSVRRDAEMHCFVLPSVCVEEVRNATLLFDCSAKKRHKVIAPCHEVK